MTIKQERVSGRIRKILSILIAREISDPRLIGITVTDVEIDAELMYAKIYVNALGEEEREAEILMALQHAKGFLRRQLAARLQLRRAPDLGFKWDASLERGERIDHLLTTLEIPPAPLENEDLDNTDEFDIDDEGYEEDGDADDDDRS